MRQRFDALHSTLSRAFGRLKLPKRAAVINQPVEISELLGRKPVNLDTPELQRFIAGKVLLVTGAGGSIGSEICRQAMRFCPARLVLLDRAENALFEIDRELRHRWVGADIVPMIADICDANRIAQVFESHHPQVVFHCAAHKHVPMMEHNPGEAIKNNIFGTKTVADAALHFEAQAFVMVSTDKAVNPTSVMGASKRVAELYVQSLNHANQIPLVGAQGAWADKYATPSPCTQGEGRGEGAFSLSQRLEEPSLHPSPLNTRERENVRLAANKTRFLAVRFGNVLGSSGSVIPIFRKQIEAGGPVTVTHPDMKRYFMTIPEASQLVMQAGAIGQGGEIFVLDMGQPIKILDLANEMIRRSGLKANEDIQIEFTGMRPGEKLYEELACDNEQTRPTAHRKIRVWQLPRAGQQQVKRMLDLLASVTQGTRDEIILALSNCVPEYQPESLKLRPGAPPPPALQHAAA